MPTLTFQLSCHAEQYDGILRPVFDACSIPTLDRLSALLRLGWLEDSGWDPLGESQRFLADLDSFLRTDLSDPPFPDVQATRWRLALLAYAHIVEADAPYEILANMLRARTGDGYSILPFPVSTSAETKGAKSSAKKRNKKKSNKAPQSFDPNDRQRSPASKIETIKGLAQRCGLPDVGAAFDDFYRAQFRNAISHSDFVLHEDEFRARRSYFREANGGSFWTSAMKLSHVGDLLGRAFGFYEAFFRLHAASLAFYRPLQDQVFAYDEQHKGILELLFDGDTVSGYRLLWPNGSESVVKRGRSGCSATNVGHDAHGRVRPMVGCYAKNPGDFSPLVERDGRPMYRPSTSGREVSWAAARQPDRV